MGFQSRPAVAATVVVTTCNRLPHLAAAVEALERQTFRDFEILVVENGPERGAKAYCADKRIRYAHEPRIGLSRARNTAARAARGDIVAYVDDDAIPQPDWLEHLVASFRDPTVGAATGTVRYMKSLGTDRAMSDEEFEPDATFRPSRTIGKATHRWFTLAALGGIGDGSNMAFRRTLVANVRLFDKRVGRGVLLDGGEEHLAFVRLIAAGHCITHAPLAIIRHPCPAEATPLLAKQFADLRTSTAFLLFLFAEFPQHRIELAGHLWRAVLRRLTGVGYSRKGRIPLRHAFIAMACGPWLFWRASRSWSPPRPKSDWKSQASGLEEAKTLE